MTKKHLFIFIIIVLKFNLLAQQFETSDFAPIKVIIPDVVLLDSIVPDSFLINIENYEYESDTIETFSIDKFSNKIEPVKLDSNFLKANPLLIPLVYKEKPNDFSTKDFLKYDFYLGKQPSSLENEIIRNKVEVKSPEQIVYDLRDDVYNHFILHKPNFFAYKQKKLPNTASVRSRTINIEKWDSVHIGGRHREFKPKPSRIAVPKIVVSPWTKKANALLQFSQNMISDNWHQGGSSNLSLLGVLTGQLNYDNKKNIQFDNSLDWRLGAHWTEDFLKDSTVITDRLNVNNDILKINTKFGLKMTGNWFYSTSADFSTQFANNYKSIRDTTMKARFLTPVRLNLSVGLDYKYKKTFSLVLSPLTWKYIYVNDTVKVDRKQFGIEAGKNHLSDFGSSFTAQLNYKPTKEIEVNSKLYFFTNYEKVESDWEIICNFTINRYLSTRLAVNTRYDNTPILKNPEEKVKIQFKEMLTFGFSYRFLN
jgi:Protein of unknown function (DUF3078).